MKISKDFLSVGESRHPKGDFFEGVDTRLPYMEAAVQQAILSSTNANPYFIRKQDMLEAMAAQKATPDAQNIQTHKNPYEIAQQLVGSTAVGEPAVVQAAPEIIAAQPIEPDGNNSVHAYSPTESVNVVSQVGQFAEIAVPAEVPHDAIAFLAGARSELAGVLETQAFNAGGTTAINPDTASQQTTYKSFLETYPRIETPVTPVFQTAGQTIGQTAPQVSVANNPLFNEQLAVDAVQASQSDSLDQQFADIWETADAAGARYAGQYTDQNDFGLGA